MIARACARARLRQALPVGLRQQHARVEQFVEQDRVPGEVVGGPRRTAHQLREPRQQRRMLDHAARGRRCAGSPLRAAPSSRIEHGLRVGGRHALGERHGQQLRDAARRSAAATAPATADSARCARMRASVATSAAGSAKPAAASAPAPIPALTSSRQIGGERVGSTRRRPSRCAGRRVAAAARLAEHGVELAPRHWRDARRAPRRTPPWLSKPIARASAARSSGAAGSVCVCSSSRYCRRCSRLRRNT